MKSIQYGVGAPITIFDLVGGLQGEVNDTAALAAAMQQALVGGGSGLDWPGSVKTISNNFAFYVDQAKRATTAADLDVIIANLHREVTRVQSLVSAMTTANDIVTYNGFHQRAFDPAWIDKINVFATDRLPVDIQRAEEVKAALGPRPLPIYIPINPGNLPPSPPPVNPPPPPGRPPPPPPGPGRPPPPPGPGRPPPPPIGGGTPQTKMCPDGSEIPINAMCKTLPGATGAATSSATPWIVGGVVAAALGAGAWWYFKKYRPTHSMAENAYFMHPYLHDSEAQAPRLRARRRRPRY